MPAKRIPWFKVWVGATRHEKVAQLDDRAFRTWVELLDGASQQTVRGKFASVEAAAAVVRRPAASIRRLMAVGLLDERADGVWMHDWQDWQRWRPEDAQNGDASPPDDPPNGYRTTHERLAKDVGLTRDQHTNSNGRTHDLPSRGAERAKTEKGEGEERSKTTSSSSADAVGAEERRVEKPNKGGEFIDIIRASGLEPVMTPGDFAAIKRCPRSAAVIAEAYIALAHGEWGDDWARDRLSARFVVSRLAGFEVWKAGSKSRQVVSIASNSRYRGDAEERAELRGGTVLGA
jgi:hypothetical protein